MDRRLEGKVALITGAGSGIGRQAAILFAREGAKVAVSELSPENGRTTVRMIETEGNKAMFIETDVTDEGSVGAAVSQTVSILGNLNIFYNNAGGTVHDDGSILSASPEGFWSSLRVNLFGTWLGCKYALQHFVAGGGGSIINTASLAGIVGIPPFHGYAAAKGGVIALTRSLAAEYASHNIRVNAIAPGMTATDKLRTGLESGRLPRHVVDRHLLGLVEPNDIAHMAMFLASDQSRHITGEIFKIDSGAGSSLGPDKERQLSVASPP